MNTNYNLEEWAAATSKGRQVYNHSYHLSDKAFKGWRLIKVVVLSNTKEGAANAYMFENPKNPGQEMIRIDILEEYSRQSAQAMLRNHLTECMRPDILSGTRNVAKIGDINFVNRVPESDIPAAIFFTRGNIFLSMNSVGEKDIDLSDFAVQLDDDLNKPGSSPAGGKEKIRVLPPKASVTLKAGDAHILIKDVRKVTPRDTWVKIIVPDGELSRKGDAIIYSSETGGAKNVSIEAISRE